jgi:hypothetical protein
MLREIEPSNRCPLRFRAPNGLVIAFTRHACERMHQRGLEAEEVLKRLSGKPLKEYRKNGVIAKKVQGGRCLKIITVFHPTGQSK